MTDTVTLINFVLKFIDTVRFDNDHFAAIMGYGYLQIRNITISRVYYVEGLGHNLFSVGKFCDSDLKVAFRKHTCFVRNLEDVDLPLGSCGFNLYTISMDEMMKSSPICLLSKALKIKILVVAPSIAEVVATACYTQNRYLIHPRYNKTPYELLEIANQNLSIFTFLVLYLIQQMILRILVNYSLKQTLESSLGTHHPKWLIESTIKGLD
ncbi:hypothetical protein Tco_0923301 [Tanacetum coccineum]|uniref:Integrase, catalytic region, zinc finger, CCHC-type, peptidase aspartic, catalytic n=1 Tax=Tanacetum coccineum TaxID=301880 RepID=A0ABQ5D3G4_9ASTR